MTETLTVPDPGGATASMREFDITVKLVAGVAPNRTGVAPVKPDP